MLMRPNGCFAGAECANLQIGDRRHKKGRDAPQAVRVNSQVPLSTHPMSKNSGGTQRASAKSSLPQPRGSPHFTVPKTVPILARLGARQRESGFRKWLVRLVIDLEE